jgi:hypothetical protein
MSLPKLPEPATVTVLHEIPYYTKSQMIAFQRLTVEACAAVCSKAAEEFARDNWQSAALACYACANTVHKMKETT